MSDELAWLRADVGLYTERDVRRLLDVDRMEGRENSGRAVSENSNS